jgi:hypothetical protein
MQATPEKTTLKRLCAGATVVRQQLFLRVANKVLDQSVPSQRASRVIATQRKNLLQSALRQLYSSKSTRSRTFLILAHFSTYYSFRQLIFGSLKFSADSISFIDLLRLSARFVTAIGVL